MRIQVATKPESRVLDTVKGAFENSSSFEVSKVGIPIIFNIQEINGERYCSCADAKVVRVNQKYDAIVGMCEKVGKKPFIVTDEDSQTEAKAAKAPKSMDLNEMKPNSKTKGKPSAQDFADTVSKELENLGKVKPGKYKAEFTEDDKEKRKQIYEENKRLVTLDNTQDQTQLTGINLEAKTKIIEPAMIIMSQNWPLYYQLLLDVDKRYYDYEPKEGERGECDTMAVSARILLINSHFALSHTVEEVVFILMHEMLHMVLSHVARLQKGDKDPTIWNHACDLIVNQTICKDCNITPTKGRPGVIVFPKGVMYSSTIDISKDLVEEVYDDLASSAGISTEKKLIMSLLNSIVQLRAQIEVGKKQVPATIEMEIDKKLKVVDDYIEKLEDVLKSAIGV